MRKLTKHEEKLLWLTVLDLFLFFPILSGVTMQYLGWVGCTINFGIATALGIYCMFALLKCVFSKLGGRGHNE